MVKDYLISLKNKGNFSWSELSKMSGLPDATIRKVFSGETADPRFETVAKLVTAMGGSMDEILSKTKEDKKIETVAVTAVKDIYEARIEEIKKSSEEQIESLKKDKRYLAIACTVLALFLLGWLLVDLMVGSAALMRVSSVMFLSASSGTLKSQRTRTFLPFT